jgi:hypothetical protein
VPPHKPAKANQEVPWVHFPRGSLAHLPARARQVLTPTVLRGLIERDVAGGLTITKQGRAVLAALLTEEEDE